MARVDSISVKYWNVLEHSSVKETTWVESRIVKRDMIGLKYSEVHRHVI